jgi:hypothetical protein
MTTQLVQWETAQARTLVDARIRSIIKSPEADSFGLKVELPNGTNRNVWVERDPEGNRPGHLAIEDVEAAAPSNPPAS